MTARLSYMRRGRICGCGVRDDQTPNIPGGKVTTANDVERNHRALCHSRRNVEVGGIGEYRLLRNQMQQREIKSIERHPQGTYHIGLRLVKC